MTGRGHGPRTPVAARLRLKVSPDWRCPGDAPSAPGASPDSVQFVHVGHVRIMIVLRLSPAARRFRRVPRPPANQRRDLWPVADVRPHRAVRDDRRPPVARRTWRAGAVPRVDPPRRAVRVVRVGRGVVFLVRQPRLHGRRAPARNRVRPVDDGRLLRGSPGHVRLAHVRRRRPRELRAAGRAGHRLRHVVRDLGCGALARRRRRLLDLRCARRAACS